MGRKIPGKKHRNIVDPEKQRAKRIQSMKNKINNPPQNPDEQEVPRSLLTIMKLKKQTQGNEESHKRRMRKNKRRRKNHLSIEQFLDKDIIQAGMKKPDKFIPKLVQHPDETDENFYHRVNSMTQKIIQEAQFEDKFDVTIKRDAKTGKILEVEKNKKMKSFKNDSKKKSLSQKRKDKIKDKATKNDGKDFSQLKDVVEFGEVTHRPPNKLNLHKNLKTHALKKTNKYEDLILQKVLKTGNYKEKEVRLK